ncbi:MAG: RNA-binding protein [Gammaproteobacteria bacterium]|nr:RNA-binding protein [Gammaproteobacteria bacterium]
MSKSVSLVKLISISALFSAIGYLLVNYVGFGVKDDGAICIALGLLIGMLIAAFMFADVKMPEAKKPVPRKNNADASRVMSIFIGNLAYKVRGRQLAALFEPFGEIQSLRIVKDRETGKAKGFGFIEMSERDALSAIAELDDSEFFGRNLKVSEANSQKVD